MVTVLCVYGPAGPRQPLTHHQLNHAQIFHLHGSCRGKEVPAAIRLHCERNLEKNTGVPDLDVSLCGPLCFYYFHLLE